MDLDVLFFNDTVLSEENLTIPHPRLHLRKFVLVPMNEVAPNFLHPGLNLTINALLLKCPDRTKCNKFVV
jgi:2-amino-4-hydroxy-6-hydroxymethyldihydropteridine diphosphokinase